MSEINKYFNQFMLAKSCVTYAEAQEFISNISDRLDETKSLKTVITETNENISKFSYRVIVSKCEVTGDKMCILINTSSDDIRKLSEDFNVADFALFSDILSEIMLSGAKCVTVISCLNLATKGSISKRVVQKIIDKLCALGYLINDKGNIYLGLRSILEFREYFTSRFDKRMTKCNLCMEFVYYGRICSNCYEVMHGHCLDQYRRSGEKCPQCGAPWRSADSRNYSDSEDSEVEDLE